MKVLHNEKVYELRGNGWTKTYLQMLQTEADNEVVVLDPRLGVLKLFKIRELIAIEEER